MMPKKKKREGLKALISWVVIIIIFFLLFKGCSVPVSESGKTNSADCPDKIEGNQNANLVIKYVESPYCIWCWFEEPILKKAIAEKGDLFMLERYDIRYCGEIVEKYGFSGTPSFVFSLKDSGKEFTHWGFLPEEKLNEVICGLSKGCKE